MQIQALSSWAGLNEALYSTKTSAARASQEAAASSLKAKASAASGGSSSSSLKDYTYDVMDLNKDGYVSFLERVIYLFTHQGSSASQAVQTAAGASDDLSSSVSSYTSQGTAVAYSDQAEPLVDLFA